MRIIRSSSKPNTWHEPDAIQGRLGIPYTNVRYRSSNLSRTAWQWDVVKWVDAGPYCAWRLGDEESLETPETSHRGRPRSGCLVFRPLGRGGSRSCCGTRVDPRLLLPLLDPKQSMSPKEWRSACSHPSYSSQISSSPKGDSQHRMHIWIRRTNSWSHEPHVLLLNWKDYTKETEVVHALVLG